MGPGPRTWETRKGANSYFSSGSAPLTPHERGLSS